MTRKGAKDRNKTRHEFLLTLFPDNEEKYAVLPMNGFVLVRQWNGGTNRWEVAVYTQEKYNNSRYFLNKKRSPKVQTLFHTKPR